jgi:uracil-DNA glycosylase family 4
MEWLGLLPSKKFASLPLLDKAVINCKECPRLVEWTREVAKTKRKSYENEKYWGKPVPGFGPDDARVIIIGLAPGAHGANRTGRIFTGDRSGDWLYKSLHKNGLAKLPTSTDINDGQKLIDTRITCAVHCAPPDNKPSNEEKAECSGYLYEELRLLMPTTKAYLVLGNLAWNSLFTALSELGETLPKPRPKFAHGAKVKIKCSDGITRLVVGSYHPSQQNTFTGKLTEAMLNSVVKAAATFH